MKLLAKSDVLKQKAEAQRVAVDEGVNLAKRVDRLREVMADEERSLEAFRERTLAQIHSETTKAGEMLNEVLGELAEAGMALAEARKPLDAEWASLTVKREALGELETDLENDRKRIEKLMEEANDKLREARNTLVRAQTREEAAQKAVGDALDAKAEAETYMNEARVQWEAVVANGLEIEKNQKAKQADILQREKAVEKQEKELQKERMLINKERVYLTDRKATLERLIKLYKNK